ncbi:hypothetical protein [Planctobacterium marinum]|uniref:Uncharacterized protein n=1 Tax=Planctobacterium marinum TaxID=1631968 RepID=A0AA48KRT0_9ALTE|nr:hypothetical protein MACH26_19580 [Planctobacterium marinum]
MKFKIIFIFTLVIFGCQDQNNVEKDLSWLLHADPIKDAKQALKVKDTRYIGIVGMFSNVPFFDDSCINEKNT